MFMGRKPSISSVCQIFDFYLYIIDTHTRRVCPKAAVMPHFLSFVPALMLICPKCQLNWPIDLLLAFLTW